MEIEKKTFASKLRQSRDSNWLNGVFGRGDMPRDFEKSEKHQKRRNDVFPTP